MTTTLTQTPETRSPAEAPDPVELRSVRDLQLTTVALERRKKTLEKLAKSADAEGYPRQARELRMDAMAIAEDILPVFRDQHELPLVTDGELEGGIANALRGLVHSFLVRHRNDVDGKEDLERENSLLESLSQRVAHFAEDVANRSYSAGYAARQDEPESLTRARSRAMPEVAEKFESWGICEVMGHVRLAGLIREETVFGVAMVRVDVSKTQAREGYTRYFGAASLYGITPTSEETARYNAENIERYSSPVPYNPPKQLIAGEPVPADVVHDDTDDDDDDDEELDEELEDQLGLRDSEEHEDANAARLTETEAHSLVLRALTQHGATTQETALSVRDLRQLAIRLLGRNSVTLLPSQFYEVIDDMKATGAIAIEESDESAADDLVYVFDPQRQPVGAESGKEA